MRVPRVRVSVSKALAEQAILIKIDTVGGFIQGDKLNPASIRVAMKARLRDSRSSLAITSLALCRR